MIRKKKISAIFAVLLLTVSFLIMIPIPIPVSAAPADAKIYLSNFLWKYPNGSVYYDTSYPFDTDLVPYLYYPAYGPLSPFNITLNYPADADKLGALPILAVIVENTTVGGFTMSSWEFGVKWIPEVFGYPVTFSPFGAPLGLPIPTIFESQYGAGNANYTAGTINIFHGEVKGFKMARNDSVSTSVTTARVLCFIIPTVVGYGETLLDIASYVKLDDQGVDITPPSGNLVNGYFKFRIHEVLLTPTVWTDPPYTTSNTLTVPINIKTTEPVHTWELNMSYYGLTEYGNPTTPTISCPSPANVSQGNFLLLSNRKSPHGGNSFNAQVGPGWVWANGTYNVATQYADSWSGATLMVINFAVQSYGTTILNVTQFSAKDPTGAEITPQPHFLDEGLRMTYFSFEKGITVAPIFVDTGTQSMMWLYPTMTIGTYFKMNVTIVDTSENVLSWRSGFRFNPLVLECLNVTEGDYLSSQGNTTCNLGVIYNTIGQVSNINCNGTVSNTGPGTLYSVWFNVTGYGRSFISLTQTDGDPCETRILDNCMCEIVSTPYGGIALYSGVFQLRETLKVKLGVKRDSFGYVTIGETFEVRLVIENTVERVSAWMSGLYFNPAMLSCTDVSFGDYLSSMGDTTDAPLINNVAGYVSVASVLLGEGLYQTGNGTLATITFQVIDNVFPIGPSILRLTDQPDDPCQTLVLDLNWDVCRLAPLVDGEVRIIGDINGDGLVGPPDQGILAAAWGSVVGQPNYIPEADLNGDGTVDSTDYGILGVNW